VNVLINFLTTPSGLTYLMAIAGLVCLCLPRLRQWATRLLAASALVLVTFSTGVIATALMSPLEHEYPRLDHARAHPQARHIVLLTGWAGDDPDLPLSGRLNDASVYRVMLALELLRECPDCEVVVTGHGDSARLMGELLLKLGLPAARLRVDSDSGNTAASARHLAGLLIEREFFLVTSAGHMPRALDAMRRAGLRAIAAPTDFRMPREILRADLAPSPYSLAVSDLAAHEYLGRVWYALRD
jgi:uncharacterized SAM-binding protein YcdF (DUF218 family)